MKTLLKLKRPTKICIKNQLDWGSKSTQLFKSQSTQSLKFGKSKLQYAESLKSDTIKKVNFSDDWNQRGSKFELIVTTIIIFELFRWLKWKVSKLETVESYMP